MQGGSEEVMITSAGGCGTLIVIVRPFVAVALTLSATCTVKLYVPSVVGVPVMTLVDELSDSPAGKDPADIVQA